MGDDGKLAAVIEQLGAQAWSGIAYRHTSRGRDPMSGLGARMAGGRWNPPESFPTIYLATSIEGCVAEFERMAVTQARGVGSFLPRDLHHIEVNYVRVLDLRAAAQRDMIGVTANDLASDDRSLCQEIGRTAHELRFEAIFAPSATGTGDVLAVFEDRVRKGQLRHIEHEELGRYLG